MKLHDFTIGADPELFFQDTQGKLISVVGQLGGSKMNPMDIGEGCAIQEDNVAAEFCIPPASNAKAFVQSINYALSDLRQRASDLKLMPSTAASGLFSLDQLKTRQAMTFGCDPDFNAYTGEYNPRPRAQDASLRSCGGHVHVGTSNDILNVVKAMDLMLAVPSVLIDSDNRRRELYGKAGAFRPKDYGVEYRTLSNFWIWKNELIEWVYHQTQQVVSKCDSIVDAIKEDTNDIITAINTGNKHLAQGLILKHNLEMP